MSAKRKAEEEPVAALASSSKAAKSSASEELAQLRTLMEMDPDDVGEDADFQGYFDKIAAHLMNSVAMVINNKHKFRLVEIEFYHKGGKHLDIFTHCDVDQKTCGEWYFHKMNGKYKGGTYKGLDISFGAKDKCFGGILIRAIQPSNDPGAKLIEGPCLVVDQILKLAGSESIQDLVARDDFTDSVWGDNTILRLAPEKQNAVRDLVKGPRVGLTLRKAEKERVEYILRDYRYLNVPEQMSKGKQFIVLSLHLSGKTSQQIVDITKTKLATVKKYIDTFEANTHPPEHFVGNSLTADALCSFFASVRKPPKK